MNEGLHPFVAAVLGALQGLTEFLPVSSSGHVAVGALLFGIPDMPLSMVVVVHVGTLLATLAVVGKDVFHLTADAAKQLTTNPRGYIETDEGKTVIGVIAATLPTAVIGLLIKDHVEAFSHQPMAVGAFLVASAAIVWTTRRRHGAATALTVKQAFLVGLAQGVAVLPGISRSGTTIAAAMWLGLSGPQAFRFSFLLSLPAILGAVILQLSDPGALAALGQAAVIAGTVAAVVGVAALLLLRRMVARGQLWVFALYLVPVGILLMLWPLWHSPAG